MNSSTPSFVARSLSCAAIVLFIAVLTACAGSGGGQLPPTVGFTGPASFGFVFSCEDNSTSRNSPAGQLRIQLSYTDHGSNPIGPSFSIHGIVDTMDPVLESMFCIGQNPPEPDPKELIFLGRYRPTSPAPAGFPSACSTRQTESVQLCRFEVIVRDNDMNRAPSAADYFQIRLSSGTVLGAELDPATVFYARAGLLSSGNLKVE